MAKFLLFLLIQFLLSDGVIANRFQKTKKTNEIKKEILTPLNSDLLPPLETVLEELDLIHRKGSLVKMGVTETRYMLRLKNMDYQMMLIEWDGDDVENEIERMKLKSQELIKIATIVPQAEAPVDNERSKLRTGRVYFPDFVQSFEYVSSGFGGSPPIGPIPIYVPHPDLFDGCTSPPDHLLFEYRNKFLILGRGNCTFLEKAQHAHRAGAKVLAIVNTEDKVESLASGLGIDPKITAEMVKPLETFPIISLSNSSLLPIFSAYSTLSSTLEGTIIPMKCSAGSTCAPVLQEEKQYQTEVTWGELTVSIQDSPQIQATFLTSTFGGSLPKDLLLVDLATLIHQSKSHQGGETSDDACTVISSDTILLLNQIQAAHASASSSPKPIGLLVKRGGCRFDQKAWSLQAMTEHGLTHPLGLMIIYDANDEPLQRLGGLHPTDGYLSIPAIMIPFHTAEFIQSALSSSASTSVTGSLSSSYSPSGFTDWVEIALTEWEEEEENKLLQLEGLKLRFAQKEGGREVERDDLMAWLERKRRQVILKQQQQKGDEL